MLLQDLHNGDGDHFVLNTGLKIANVLFLVEGKNSC